MEDGKTKQGYVMNRKLRARIVAAVAEGRGIALADIAAQLGIHRRTLQDYLTKDVRAEIAAAREGGGGITLDDVDWAMMAQARAGNVAAARLVYMRVAQKGEMAPLPSLDDMEIELLRLKHIENLKKGARDGDSDAQAAAGPVAGAGEG